jgi:hypothetical protein
MELAEESGLTVNSIKSMLKNRKYLPASWLHPIILKSRLKTDDKLFLQRSLDSKFRGDIAEMIRVLILEAIEEEDYEAAIIIRDELQSQLNQTDSILESNH